MNTLAREITIRKLGTLMLANTEIAAQNEILAAAVKQRDARILELEAENAQLRQPRLDQNGADRPVGDNIPANPYERNGRVGHA